MSVNVAQRMETDVVPTTAAMPPPAAPVTSETSLFRGLDELRSGHRLGGYGRERLMHAVAALVGTGVIFGILYASMLFLE